MTNDNFFLQAFNAVSEQDFEERPVEIEEFVTSEKFLGLPPLSDIQYMIVRVSSQIYKLDTLIALYGDEKGRKRYAETYNEIILQIGKGAGKDYTSSIAMCYIIYLLLCLKDPATYYGQPRGNHIDLLNIAINSDQAQRVFFKYMKERLMNCPWFEGRYKTPIPPNMIEFDKGVTLYSGHSEREVFEGLNLFMAVLDEISGFALESTTGNVRANTAQATYDTYRDSVDSRFEKFGKVSMLSFPRFEDDFIQQKYNAAIAEKETIIKTHTFKVDEDLPDGTEGNEFTISWEHDNIIRYAQPHTFALRRPSWDVRPDRDIESYKLSFFRNPGNALGKFACQPSNLEDGFFKNHVMVDNSFKNQNGVDNETGTVFIKPKRGVKYYLHVDLAQKHDYCAVAMSHVEKWVDLEIADPTGEPYPYIIIDLVRYWKPTKDKTVDFKEVRNFIVHLKRMGFDIEVCTFDRWNSLDTMKYLTEEHGIETETLSVALQHYQDFQTVMYDGRLEGPMVPDLDPTKDGRDLLKKELKELRIVKNKIDHPRSGYKDLSDASCGAVFNAVDRGEKPEDTEVEVLTYADVRARLHEDTLPDKDNPGVIVAPKKSDRAGYSDMPDDISNWLSGLRVL